MVVAAGGNKYRILPVALCHLKAEHVAVKRQGTIEIGDLQVHMADAYPRIYRTFFHDPCPGCRGGQDSQTNRNPQWDAPTSIVGGYLLIPGRSAINRRHDPIGIPLPRDFTQRQSTVERLHFWRIQLNGLGRHILLQLIAALGARYRHDGGTMRQPIVKAISGKREIVPAQILNLRLSVDHRVIDGATGARFMQELKAILEAPLTMLV